MSENGSPVSPNIVRPVTSQCDGQVRAVETSAEREIGKEGIYGAEEVVVDDEPARAPSIAPRPKGPTKAKIIAHQPLHLNYRSWCPSCVHGRGHSQHYRATGAEGVQATWHMDYCFPGEKCEVKDVDDGKSENATVLCP